MEKSLITVWLDWPDRGSAGETSNVDIDTESLCKGSMRSSRFSLIINKMPRMVGRASRSAFGTARSSCYTDFVLKNITITVSEEAARWARRKAAEENTSVSKLVGRMLEEQMRR